MPTPIPCVIFKDRKMIGTFESATKATAYLEQTIEGKLYEGVLGLLRGWTPQEDSQLYGYSAKRL